VSQHSAHVLTKFVTSPSIMSRNAQNEELWFFDDEARLSNPNQSQRPNTFIRNGETSLSLYNGDIDVHQAKQIANELALNTSLKFLDLRYNMIGDEGTVALAGALTRNTSLHTLRLCRNEIGLVGIEALAGSLMRTSLKELSLIGNKVGDRGAVVLANALATNQSLTMLDLGATDIGDVGIAALAQSLVQNDSLRRLSVGTNQFGILGWMAFVNGLKANRGLTELRVHADCIDDQGTEALINALKDNSTLAKLDLGSNLIGVRGLAALAEALTTNTTLIELNLASCYFGDDGVAALAGGLAGNMKMKKLFLHFNFIGDDGARSIANALKTNTTLTELGLDRNRISSVGAAAILKTLKECNCTLTSLGMRNNGDISPLLQESIDFVLSSNRVLDFWADHLRKPLKGGVIPFVFQAVQRSCAAHTKLRVGHFQETAAGPIFQLLKTGFLVESEVTREAAPSRKRSTTVGNQARVAHRKLL
jgi:Ran GTPase-activating protein (RanGAP) involved in mRNA processing and transport